MRRSAKERIAGDPFGIHEALHTAHVLMDSYATHVVEHPAVELRPDILDLGEKAIAAMMEVYQALGQLNPNK